MSFVVTSSVVRDLCGASEAFVGSYGDFTGPRRAPGLDEWADNYQRGLSPFMSHLYSKATDASVLLRSFVRFQPAKYTFSDIHVYFVDEEDNAPPHPPLDAKEKRVVNEKASQWKKRGPSSSKGNGLVRDLRRAWCNNHPDIRGTVSINIGFYHDELDSTMLEMLHSVLVMASATVYKYLSHLYEKAAEEALLEDIMMMETMNMVRSLVLNSELNSKLKGYGPCSKF
ncbi:hypothetical protein Adt_42161 [Abeliophyllum distichum]|uniref:Uncharacterized protein n=1 Tax=Abeliophyllum distichum TaxID=126358 RepID=A0ABD1PQW0_9LAMI